MHSTLFRDLQQSGTMQDTSDIQMTKINSLLYRSSRVVMGEIHDFRRTSSPKTKYIINIMENKETIFQ